MNLKTQRRLAAQILKCGENRVWIDPDRVEEVSEVISREGIRDLIKEGVIRRNQKKGISRGRWREKLKKGGKGRMKGYGSRKGKRGAREPKKRKWIKKIRAIRDELKKLKLGRETYRKLYRLSKSGAIMSRRHLREYIKIENVEEEKKIR